MFPIVRRGGRRWRRVPWFRRRAAECRLLL